MYLKKQDLNELDYDTMGSMSELELMEYAIKHLQPHHKWLLPQLVANFGRWQLATSNGRIDIPKTMKLNCSDPKQQVLWRLVRLKRSSLIQRQVQCVEYSQLVPLLLLAQKQYRGVQYQEWQGLAKLEWILEPALYNAVVLDGDVTSVVCNLGSQRLLEIRNQGLLNKSGKNKGELKPVKSTWSLTGIQDTELANIPKLAQTILCQIWLASPELRHQNMILDLQNWDRMPKPIAQTEIFNMDNTTTTTTTLPWL